jgi:hypothetical protein
MEFTSWNDFHAWAMEHGADREQAYEAWRKAWWCVNHPDRTWRARHRGIKQGGRRYRDASTLTEAIAT